MLNRILRWEESGVEYEPDQRHAEQVLETLDTVDCRGVTTPGSRDDVARATRANDVDESQQMVVSSAAPGGPHQMVTSSDEAPHVEGSDGSSSALPPAEATKYRAVSARLNYLCQDRVDISYACKEAARRMSSPKI